MAFLSTNAILRALPKTMGLIKHGQWVEGFFDFGDNPTVTSGDLIDFFDEGVFQGYYIGDWYVKSERLDTGATPTLTVNVGFGDATGVSGTAGYLLAQNKPFGGTAAGVCLRDEDFRSHVQAPPARRLGISIVTAPAVAAFANKRLRFGVLPLAMIHSR